MFKRILSLLLLCLLVLPAARAEEHPEYVSRTLMTMDYFSTTSTLVIFDDFKQPGRMEKLTETWAEIKEILASLDALLSLSNPDSDCARFNALPSGASMQVSDAALEILRISETVNGTTGGLYDPTVSRLVDLYGFSPRFTPSGYQPTEAYDRPRLAGRSFSSPDARYVDAFRGLVSFPEVDWASGTVKKTAPDVVVDGVSYAQTIDLGSIGKGYAVDLVMALLRERGYEYGYFSCGGSSIGVLKRGKASKGAPLPAQWGVAIEKPRFSTNDSQIALRVFTNDTCLSTSGDDAHTYTLDGVRYCHIVDPGTGRPINVTDDGSPQRGLCAVTVYGENAALCDAWSTALSVAGLTQSLEWINSGVLNGCDVVMIVYADSTNYCEFVTTLSENSYEVTDPDHFVLASDWVNGVLTYTGKLLA